MPQIRTGLLSEIFGILNDGREMTARQIADEINRRGMFVKSTGTDVTADDVRHHLRENPYIFSPTDWSPRRYIINPYY